MAEQRTELIYLIFSVLAISIACLGLFGLSAFITERRMKEVSVRKVLGASIMRIVFLLTGQFLKWVIIANLIAWPIAWFLMSHWLNDFVYRITIGWWIFLAAGIITLFIAQVTVITQTVRAAITNPAHTLKFE